MPDFTDNSDYLNRSSVLRRAVKNRVEFNPMNATHLESLEIFMETGNWGDVQFYCEHPYTDVPMTVLMKFVHQTLGTVRESEEDRAVRFSKMNLHQYKEETNAEKLARIQGTNRMVAQMLLPKAKRQQNEQAANRA